MKDILIYFIINGTAFFATCSLIVDAVKALKGKPISDNGPIYNTEHERVDLEKLTVTYDRLPKSGEEVIKNSINLILSGIVTAIAWVFEFIVNAEIQITLNHRIVGSLLVGVIIAIMLDVIKKIISYITINLINIYAKRNGLVRKLSENASVIS